MGLSEVRGGDPRARREHLQEESGERGRSLRFAPSRSARRSATLSHGYRQRVGLGQALIHDPPILILDEPTSDLDPNEKAEVLRYIKEIGKDRTILLSTHNLNEVEEACARAIIVRKGAWWPTATLDDIRGKTGPRSLHGHDRRGGREPPTLSPRR